jgi:hypothetical protein
MPKFQNTGDPFRIALFMPRSTIFFFLQRLKYKDFSHNVLHASSMNYYLHLCNFF